MRNKKEVQIAVRGATGSGKTLIAGIIEKALHDGAFENISVERVWQEHPDEREDVIRLEYSIFTPGAEPRRTNLKAINELAEMQTERESTVKSGEVYVWNRARDMYYDQHHGLSGVSSWSDAEPAEQAEYVAKAKARISHEDAIRRSETEQVTIKGADNTPGNVGINVEYGPVRVGSVSLETSKYHPNGVESGPSIPASVLYTIAEDMPIFDVQIAALYLGGSTFTSCDSMFDIVFHLKRCMDVDTSKPILIGADGHIMDGCHRIMRAMLDGRTHIPAKRFAVQPEFDEHGICINKGE